MVALQCCIINFVEMLGLFCLSGSRVVFGLGATSECFFAKTSVLEWSSTHGLAMIFMAKQSIKCTAGLSSPIRIQGFAPQSI